ncbi:hypothetical protein, partial [Caldibacillus debilis]|uniref:hypothetical protein n=1 Tax=Caldibacillus debilis TaxID=301148 RepID=UPI001C7D5DB4
PFDPLTNDFVTLQFFFAQWNSLLSHTDIFTEALQYDNITDEQQLQKFSLTLFPGIDRLNAKNFVPRGPVFPEPEKNEWALQSCKNRQRRRSSIRRGKTE